MSILNFQTHIRVLVNALSVFECDLYPNLHSDALSMSSRAGTLSQLDLITF